VRALVVVLAAIASLLGGCTPVEMEGHQAKMAIKEKIPFEKREEEIYAHMRRYGINRDDVATLRRLYEESPPHFEPRIQLRSEKLLKSGEHYRIEMDEYILTMRVPEGDPMPGNWVWPYNNTRNPELDKFLKQNKGSLSVASLGWYTYGPPSIFGGKYDHSGVSIFYRILTPEMSEKYSTPERMQKTATEILKSYIPTQADIERTAREQLIDNRKGNRIVLKPEPVVINGRIWIRDAMHSGGYNKRTYSYTTYLRPGRFLIANFGLPQYDYDANPDPATYPKEIRQAIARMDEMVASLRIAKINDDGAPDPFVIERVEPAPLPVREPLPSAHP